MFIKGGAIENKHNYLFPLSQNQVLEFRKVSLCMHKIENASQIQIIG